MADTTQANVLDIAPELSTVGSNTWTIVLADAALEFTEDEFTTTQYIDAEEIIQRYYVAHVLTLLESSGTGGGALKREKVHHVEREYSTVFNNSDLLSTKYGAVFKRLYHKYRRIRML